MELALSFFVRYLKVAILFALVVQVCLASVSVETVLT